MDMNAYDPFGPGTGLGDEAREELAEESAQPLVFPSIDDMADAEIWLHLAEEHPFSTGESHKRPDMIAAHMREHHHRGALHVHRPARTRTTER